MNEKKGETPNVFGCNVDLKKIYYALFSIILQPSSGKEWIFQHIIKMKLFSLCFSVLNILFFVW